MSDYGLSDTGFNRKPLNVIVSETEDNYKAIFGENFDVTPQSPAGQVIGVDSESRGNLWELAEAVYNSINPNGATGDALSRLVLLNGIERQQATQSRSSVNLTGIAGTLIPAGSLISTSDTNAQFSTDLDVTLDGAGNGVITVTSVDFGPIQALAGTLTRIDTPVTGWVTVNNPADAFEGTQIEGDADLRARRERSTAGPSQGYVDTIFARVSNVDGVTQSVVLENDTNVTDINGLPPHSVSTIAIGGDDQEIARQISIVKPCSISTFGNTTVPITDSQGFSNDINFSRPTTIAIYVEVTITTDSTYPANGDELIKQAIVDYANGDLIQGRGFSLGDDVIYTRLYTPINSVQGHEIDSLFIGTSAPPVGTVNIPISVTEISNFDVSNITVNS